MAAIVQKRLVWLDFLKGLAILAVVINHVFDSRISICPSDLICQLSFFSVSLFVICGGVSASMSLERCKEYGGKWRKMLSRITSLLGYYTIALILTILLSQGRFDFGNFLSSWISFPAQYYFVLFFCELLFVAPIVYVVLNKCRGNMLKSMVLVLCIALIAFYGMFFTNIPQVYGGGGRLMGGSYLLLFSLGMFFAINISLSIKKTLMSIVCIMIIPLLVAIVLKFLIGGSRGLVWALNPPGILRMCYALSLFVGFYILLKLDWLQSCRPVLAFAWLGKHSLDIFLYHMLVLAVLLKFNLYGWMWAVCCCLMMIFGAVAIGKGVRWAVDSCRQCY